MRRAARDEEAATRAVNAEPWEPLPGMVKRRCPRCRYFFAAPKYADEPHCADCVIALRRG
jgi:hypothetical protein